MWFSILGNVVENVFVADSQRKRESHEACSFIFVILSSFDLGLPATEEVMNSVDPSHYQGDTSLNHEDVQEDMLHEVYRSATEVSIILSIFYFLFFIITCLSCA